MDSLIRRPKKTETEKVKVFHVFRIHVSYKRNDT